MCTDIFDNQDWYCPIPKSLITSLTYQLYNMVDEAYYFVILDENTWEYVRMNHPREATFTAKSPQKSKETPGKTDCLGKGLSY